MRTDLERLRDIVETVDFEVDWEIVWAVIAKDLSPLRKSITEIADSEGWIL